MPTILLTSIEVRKRQRTKIPSEHINSLKESILAHGNIHPPVCWQDPKTEKWILTAGECRLRAIKKIAEEKKTYHCGLETIPPGSIFIMPVQVALEVDAHEIELDENVRRLDLSWQDRAQAYADLHTLRLAENPKQTLADTKLELIEKGAQSLHVAQRPLTGDANWTADVREALILSENLHDEKIALARNPREALQLIYKREEEKALSALIRRTKADDPAKTSLVLKKGDLKDLLLEVEAGSVDLIIADPPYGIGASGGGFRDRTIHHHNYNDTPENAQAIWNTILTEGFRVAKPRANIFIFCDIDNFPALKRAAANYGWVPFRRPLIWRKSESEGLAPWGGSGPRITTEFILYATKGQRGMNVSPIDVFEEKRVSRSERTHAAEKPVELIKRLIECTTLHGDKVLDPCMGSGSTLVACRELGRAGIGIEIDADYFNTAYANVFSTATEIKDAKEGS